MKRFWYAKIWDWKPQKLKTKGQVLDRLGQWRALEMELYSRTFQIPFPWITFVQQHRINLRYLTTKQESDYAVRYPNLAELNPDNPILQTIFLINIKLSPFAKGRQALDKNLEEIHELLESMQRKHSADLNQYPGIIDYIREELAKFLKTKKAA